VNLYSDLRHTRPRSAAHTAPTTAKAKVRQNETGREGDEEEPHKHSASLYLAAPLPIVEAPVADPATTLVLGAAAVGHTQLGSQHDGTDEGEEHGDAVGGEECHGDGDAVNEAGCEAVDGDEPRDNDDEHGEVDCSCGGARGVDVGGDDVAD